MDIDLLSKMVKELILDRDKVVLPGLGAFVAEIVSSTFSDKGYTINPPYRRLFFRSKPDAGSELAAFYAVSNKVPVSAAEKIIADFCSELKGVLYDKKTVVFPGLGRLRATKENHVFFVADEDLDIYPAGFGLEPVSLKTHQETQEEVSAAVADLKQFVNDMPQSVVLPNVPEVPTALGASMVSEGLAVELANAQQEQVEQRLVEEETAVSEVVPAETASTETAVAEDLQEGSAPVAETASTETASTEAASVEESVEEALSEKEEAAKPWWKTFLKVVMWVLVAAIVLLLAYVVIGRACPDLVDTFLYTPEEMEIVRNL